jgi:hypothetical protein
MVRRYVQIITRLSCQYRKNTCQLLLIYRENAYNVSLIYSLIYYENTYNVSLM